MCGEEGSGRREQRGLRHGQKSEEPAWLGWAQREQGVRLEGSLWDWGRLPFAVGEMGPLGDCKQ